MKQLSNVEIIGIDVETTAIDPREGEIIEVAAVKYLFSKTQSTKVKQSPKTQFVKLCKPSGPISEEITALTGITYDMVADAPTFAEIRGELQEFIGDSLIFAHNASFDVKWLTYHGLNLANNKVWDTFMIASVTWPEAESYNLGALSQELRIKNQEYDGRSEHSAEYDVEMAWRVLQRARKELVARPETHKKIIELLEKVGLGHYVPLFRCGEKGQILNDQFFPPRRDPSAAGQFSNATTVLGSEGPLAEAWEGFTPRPEQQRMAQEVELTLEEGGVSLIEAPTGIGKTVGYLTPVLLKLMEHPISPSAIISTHTKHLQDQLLSHDLPALQAAMRTNYSASVLKGRRNYLCWRRLGAAFEREKLQPTDAWLLIKARLWLDREGSGI